MSTHLPMSVRATWSWGRAGGTRGRVNGASQDGKLPSQLPNQAQFAAVFICSSLDSDINLGNIERTEQPLCHHLTFDIFARDSSQSHAQL